MCTLLHYNTPLVSLQTSIVQLNNPCRLKLIKNSKQPGVLVNWRTVNQCKHVITFANYVACFAALKISCSAPLAPLKTYHIYFTMQERILPAPCVSLIFTGDLFMLYTTVVPSCFLQRVTKILCNARYVVCHQLILRQNLESIDIRSFDEGKRLL